MIDQQILATAAERLPPEARANAVRIARERGVSVADVVLEAHLEDVQGQLYSLRAQSKPGLRVVGGGRA